MKIRTLFLLAVLVAVGVFAALNWGVFTTPTTLSLGFGVVRAPLGLIMLGLTAFLTVLFIAFAVVMRTSAFFDARRYKRDLQAARDLADRAETSRFTAIQETLEKEAGKLNATGKESREAILARLDRLEGAVSAAIEQTGNSLAAYIGELGDTLEKKTSRPQDGRNDPDCQSS